MKNLLKVFAALLAVFTLGSCRNPALISAGKIETPVETEAEKGNLVIRFSKGGSGRARTITSLDSYYVNEMNWDLEFFEVSEIDGEQVKTPAQGKYIDSTDDGEEYLLPYGDYIVTASAQCNDRGAQIDPNNSSDIAHTLYGESEIFTISEGRAESVTIFVSLKKNGGTGAFGPVSVGLSDVFSEGIPEGVTFDGKLVPVSGEGEIVELEYITVTYDDKPYVNFGKDSKGQGNPADFGTYSEINSGFYYFTVSYTQNGEVYNLALEDSLVEIGDDEAVQVTISALNAFRKREYYAVSTTSDNNGLSPLYPAYIYDLLANLKEDEDWREVKIHMSEVPELSVSALDLPYTEGSNTIQRSVTFEVNENRKGSFTVSADPDTETLSINADSGAFQLKLNGGTANISGLKSGDICVYGLNLKENALVNFIEPELRNGMNIKLYVDHADDYVSTEFATVKTTSTNNISFELYEDDEFEYKEEAYLPVYSDTTSGEYRIREYSISPANPATVGIGTAIPQFKLTASIGENSLESGTEIYFEDNEICFKVAPENEYDEFEADTNFKWYVNAKEVSGEVNDTFKITPSTFEGYLDTAGNNTVMCVVSYNNEYKSVSFVLKFKEVKEVLGMYTAKKLVFYESKDVSNATTIPTETSALYSTAWTDFATDKDGNIYVAEDDLVYRFSIAGGPTSKEKIFNGTSGRTNFKLYMDPSDNNTLYMAYYASDETKFYVNKLVSPATAESTDWTTCSMGAMVTVDGHIQILDTFTDFAVVGSTAFVIATTRDDEDKQYIFKATLGEDSEFENTLIDISSFDTGTEAEYIYINDIVSVDGENLYVLVAERNVGSADYPYSRGAVLKLNIFNIAISSENTYGFYTADTAFTYAKDNDTLLETHAASYFFGPQKLLAVTPKKLYIADEGCYDYAGSAQATGTTKDINRVVSFDLENNKIVNGIKVDAGFDYSTVNNDSQFCYAKFVEN